MTISSNVRKAGPYTGNNVTTAFPFTFKVFQASDVVCTRLTVSSGSETVLTINTDYTVSLNADQNSNPGGTVNLLAALASTYTLTITSFVDYLQPTDLTNQGGFYPSVITDSLDRSCIQTQQLKDNIDRSLKISVTTPAGVSTQLPAPVANEVIGWDNTGEGLRNWAVSDLVSVTAYGTATADIFTGNGTTTVFTLSFTPANIYNLDVSINGVTQIPNTDYTWTSGTTLTFTSAPPTGLTVLVRYLRALAQGTVDWGSVSSKPFISSAVAINQTISASALGYTAIEVLDGGSFAVATGCTFTIDVPFRAPLKQVFSLTGTGAVAFGAGSVSEVYPEWWGVDGVADEIQINSAIISVSTYGGKVYLSPKTYSISNSIVAKNYVSIIGVYGEPVEGGDGPGGTIIEWAGGSNGNMMYCYDIRKCTFSQFTLDGKGNTTITGILYSSSAGGSAENRFEQFTINNCYVGVHWGTTGQAGTDASQGQFVTFTIWSHVANSIGFIVDSGNVGQQCLIEHGGIQTQAIGIDLRTANLLQIRRVFGAWKMATAFIQFAYGFDITISGCSSECWGAAHPEHQHRHNDTYFLKVVTPTPSADMRSGTCLTMIGNQINNPILITSNIRIVSVGDSWGYCWDSVTDASVPATGTCTSGASNILVLNSGVNPSSIDLTTNLPTHGWLYGSYCNLSLVDPQRGWISPAFNASNFSASGSMTWVLTNVDVETYSFVLVDRTMTVSFKITTSTIGGTVSDTLKIKIPASKTTSKTVVSTCRIVNGSAAIGYCYVDSGDTWIQIKKVDASNFALGTDNVVVQGQISFEVS